MDNVRASECKVMYIGREKILCQCPLHSIKLIVSTEAKESSVTIDTSVSTSQHETADKKIEECGEVAR